MKQHSIVLLLSLSSIIATAQSFLDPSFGTGGYATLDIDGSYDQFTDMVVQPDGKIVAVGHANLSETNPLIARFHSNGALDLSFNAAGWAVNPVAGWEGPGEYTGVALQADGKIVCAGRARPLDSGPTNILVTRYLENGSLDPDFGTNGYALLPPPLDGIWRARDVVITPAGKILLCGFSEIDPTNDNEMLVIQLLEDGSFDPDFGTAGVVAIHPGDPQLDFEAFDMALQSDGRIVLATEGRVDAPGFVAVWACRLLPDGTFDTGFGENGLVINYDEGTAAWNVVIGPDDEVFLAGYGNMVGNYQDVMTMRLDANGTDPVNAFYECCNEESLMSNGAWFQDDGNVIVLGLNGNEAYLMRWQPNGTLDPSFGNAGLVTETTIDIDPVDQTTGELWVEDNGRMLVCGRSGVVPGNGDDAIIMAFYPAPVGIQEAGSFTVVQVAPVPASDRILLTVDPSLIGGTVMLELISSNGAKVYSQSIAALAQQNTITIPANLGNGVYTLLLRSDAGTIRPARVILQR